MFHKSSIVWSNKPKIETYSLCLDTHYSSYLQRNETQTENKTLKWFCHIWRCLLYLKDEQTIISRTVEGKGPWQNNFSVKKLKIVWPHLSAAIKGEGVGTSTIRTSTGQKFQNVEMVFLVDQNVEIRTSKMSFELNRTTTIRTSKIALKYTFDVVIFCDAIGKIRTSKCFLTKETFDVLIFYDAIGKFRTSKWILCQQTFRRSDFTYGVTKDQNVESRNWCKRSIFDVVSFSGNIRKIRTSKNVDICCNVII